MKKKEKTNSNSSTNEKLKEKVVNKKNNVDKNIKKKESNKKDNRLSIFDKFKKKDKKSAAVRKYQNKKSKKKRQKKFVNGKFTLDVLDILIIVVATAIVSCLFTGFILNYQYKKNYHYLTTEVAEDENVKEFLDTYTEIINNFYEEVDKDKLIEAALEGMVNFLQDNYSIYLNKDETDALSESLDGSYEGIGIVAMGNVVCQVYEGSPADKAGLKEGDEIININGTEITLDNYSDIASFLSKEKDNTVVVKRDGKEKTFKIEVKEVEIPSVSTDIITSSDKKEKIGYLKLATFSSHSFEEFQEELLALEKDKIDSLIIDLRGNTGGYLNVAEDIASLFLEKGKVIYSLENKNKTTKYKDETKDSRKYKVVVLVNENTASAAEILAAALKDSYGATLVGKTTFGKGKVQTMKYYEDTMIKYTSAKWLRPNGECVDEVGIVPDYDVELKQEENIIYDLQLDKAINILS